MFCSKSYQSCHGIAVYQKNRESHFSAHTFACIECAIAKIENNLFICFVYCPPKVATVANYTIFLQKLKDIIPEQAKIVLMGDFNYDHKENSFIAGLFYQKLQLRQLIQSVSTDYGTNIDHIYTNLTIQSLKAYGTLESYYSDHKPLFLVFEIDHSN